MNTAKMGSYSKLIAFFLVAVILLCAFGFAVEGWQPDYTQKPDSSDADTNSNADNNKEEPPEIPAPEEPAIPEFTNPLTGLETTEQEAKKRHYCFVFSSDAPTYGLSASDIVIELPTEGNDTRLLSFVSDFRSLGKIGSIAPSRGYMSNLARNFNCTLVSYGNDDTVSYDSLPISSHFDLSVHKGYHYTEYSLFNYTNGDLIAAGLANANVGAPTVTGLSLPYLFNDFGNAGIVGAKSAKSVSIPFSETTATEFYYSAAENCYAMSKNGIAKKDMLNDSAIKFDNLFILFADTVTYEGECATEMIMNTIGSGKGFYISGGTAQNITWTADPLGNMTFYNDASGQLIINRGTSYIGFAKSSKIADVSIS